MALVGLIESLLTLSVIDEMTETRGKGNQESFAQGAANLVCGFFGGMGGCAMIGQSVINVSSGGQKPHFGNYRRRRFADVRVVRLISDRTGSDGGARRFDVYGRHRHI